jgi:SAM-dependent methyltransferase
LGGRLAVAQEIGQNPLKAFIVHQSSYDKMMRFRSLFLDQGLKSPLVIYDLGSQDINGTYRPIFSNPNWRYMGIDTVSGKNVDIVLHNPYVFRELRSNSADVIISGQAFEHIEYFWVTMLEIVRVLKPGGICCILAPSSGPEHRYPCDCWRFYSDGMQALAFFAQMEVLEASTQWDDLGYVDCSDQWHDSMLVCRKPNRGLWENFKSDLKRRIKHFAMTIDLP